MFKELFNVTRVIGAALLGGTVMLAGAAQAETVLKFSHTDNPGGSRQAAAEVFAKKVAEYTEGRYKVRIYPAGQLAKSQGHRAAATGRC